MSDAMKAWCRSIKLAAVPLVAWCGLSVAAAAEILAARESWAAIRTGGRCIALSRAVRWRGPGAAPVLALTVAPGVSGGQVHVRFGGRVTAARLTVGNAVLPLRLAGVDGWTRDAAADGAVRATLRTVGEAWIDGRDAAGRVILGRFSLAGAPTALDAARLACPERRWKNRPSAAISRAP